MSEPLGTKISKVIIFGLGVKEGASVIMAPLLDDFTSVDLASEIVRLPRKLASFYNILHDSNCQICLYEPLAMLLWAFRKLGR